MKARAGQTFQIRQLTGTVESVCSEGAVIGFALVSKSGHSQAVFGDMAVLLTQGGRRRVQMKLAIAPRFHEFEFISELRSAVFAALEIPDDETWALRISPSAVIEMLSKPPDDGYMELFSWGESVEPSGSAKHDPDVEVNGL